MHICIMKNSIMIMLTMLTQFTHAQINSELKSIAPLSTSAYQVEEKELFAPVQLIASSAFALKTQVGTYVENRYMVKAMNNMRFAFLLRTDKGGMAIGGQLRGSNGFSSTSFNIGYGMRLSEKLGIGVKLEGAKTTWPGRISMTRIGYQAGLLYQLPNNTSIGIHISNNRFLRKFKNSQLPGYYVVQTGIGKKINQYLYAICEFIKESDKPILVIPTIDWKINELFRLKAGISPPLNMGSVLLGWKIKKENLSLAFSSHSYLGFSSGISITHDF